MNHNQEKNQPLETEIKNIITEIKFYWMESTADQTSMKKILVNLMTAVEIIQSEAQREKILKKK